MIEIVVRPRQGGKTTELLQWMQEGPDGEHRVCVSHSLERAMDLWRQARQDYPHGTFESWQFVSLEDLKPGAFSGVMYGRRGRVVLGVDDIDLLLHHFFRWPVGMVTVTGEPR